MNLLSQFLLTCLINSIGIGTLIVISITLVLLSSAMFFYIARKRKKSDLTLNSFSADVKQMLDKINGDDNKIRALEQLITRIENDEAYRKTPDWKKSVLVKVYEHMASVHYQMTNEEGVIEATSKIIDLDPSDGKSYYNRGSIYNNQGKLEKAITDFNNAILLMPDYSSAYNNRGFVYNKLGKYEEALADFDYAIGLDPSAITYFNRANLYLEQNEYLKAKEDYLKYLEIDPDDYHKLKEDVLSAINYIDNKLSTQ